eukprot:s107_g41.t1
MVTETNLEIGRPREHQVEFFFFKLVGDWPMAQRMGNYWRQHYGLDTYPVEEFEAMNAEAEVAELMACCGTHETLLLQLACLPCHRELELLSGHNCQWRRSLAVEVADQGILLQKR